MEPEHARFAPVLPRVRKRPATRKLKPYPSVYHVSIRYLLAAHSSRHGGRMSSVLVIDDEPGQREVLRLLLEDAGYHVEEVASGEAGLALLRATRERMVVLLDQRMPGIGGDEVLSLVAADPSLATRHAYILVTASPRKPGTDPVVAPGRTVPVVDKPFDVEALLGVVAAAAASLQT